MKSLKTNVTPGSVKPLSFHILPRPHPIFGRTYFSCFEINSRNLHDYQQISLITARECFAITTVGSRWSDGLSHQLLFNHEIGSWISKSGAFFCDLFYQFMTKTYHWYLQRGVIWSKTNTVVKCSPFYYRVRINH